MKRKYDLRTITLIAILILSNFGVMGFNYFYLILPNLFENFSESIVNLCLSVPNIVGLFACMIAGKVCDKMDKKKVFIAGMVLFAISGTVYGGVGYGSDMGLFTAAIISAGICYGMISVSSLGLISDCFTDEDQRSKVVGFYNGGMAAVGAVLSLVFGALAVIDWKLPSAANWSALVVAILAIFFIPSCPPKQAAADTAAAEKAKGEKGWAKGLIPLLLSLFAVNIGYMALYNYVSVYVEELALGDVLFTGSLGTIQTICSFAACSLFGFTYGKFKNKIIAPGYIALAIGVGMMFLLPSKATAVIGTALCGFAWGTVYTGWFYRATVVVPENMVGTSTGLITAVNCLAYVPLPYIVSGLMGSMGGYHATMPVYTGILLVVGVIAIFYNAKTDK